MNIFFSFLALFLLIPSIVVSQDFTITRIQPGSEVINQAIVYSLPRTSLSVNLELTKYVIKKGPYAEFAHKYLGLANVAMSDSVIWRISGVEGKPVNEPDPANYYALVFKTLPSNLNTIYSLHNHGILLNASDVVNNIAISPVSNEYKERQVFDPQFIEDVLTERTDTFYKTIMNDTAFVRIPVFKKQILAKNQEELAKETAHELIKTRKRRIKFIRGEYDDFHPDAATLRIMIDEMQKQEEIYLQLFQGFKMEQKFTVNFHIMPSENLSTIELGYFSEDKGFSKSQSNRSNTISVHFQKNEIPTSLKFSFDNLQKNIILYRVPSVVTVTFALGENEISKIRVPFYQFGTIQTLYLKSK